MMENTYGDRLHEYRRTRRQRLEGVSEHALINNSMVRIAAFSIGRTQEPLYELEEITRLPFAGASKGQARKTVINPIVPSGQATGVRREAKAKAKNSGQSEINWPTLPIVLDFPFILGQPLYPGISRSKIFWGSEGPLVVAHRRQPPGIPGNGASFGASRSSGHCRCRELYARSGRIVNYLRVMLRYLRHDVRFISYQVQCAPGWAFQMYGKCGFYVEFDHEHYNIGAKINTVGGSSAHADQ